ncbi:alternative ribosome rescue aminoacyl-tRNA hydrolase ArfB [soil metagenome]
MESNHIPRSSDLISEINFTTSRSSGPGGQNVNKVNSKVTLKFDVARSQILTEHQKEIVLRKLSTRMTNDGVLVITSQEKRSQLQNKGEVLQKLDDVFVKIFTPRKPRKATRPGKAAVRKRIDEKKQRSQKKQWRQKPD